MRKIIVINFMSLDGVIQAPGGPQEDTSDNFSLGGWSSAYQDEVSGAIIRKQMQAADYLLGRRTFEIWESYWPMHAEFWPGINEGAKYVFSKSRASSDWQHTSFIDSIEQIKALKNSDGADLQVWGSSQLVHFLLHHDLVDELWLKTFPIILGKGKRLFDDSSLPAAFELSQSTIAPSGVIIANYKRAGAVQSSQIEI